MSNEAVSQILEAKPEQAVESAEATVETKPEAKKDERVSSRLEVLMRREQAALKAERQAQAKQKELEDQLKKFEEFNALKQSPQEALKYLGFSNDDYVRTTLNDGEVPAEVKLRKLEEKYDSKFNELDEQKKRQEIEYQQQIKQKETEAEQAFKSEIKTYLSDNSERYELTLFENQESLIYDVVDEHYNRTIDPQTGVGKIMKISDAADKVEAWLEKKEAERKNLKKSQALWGAVPEKAKQELTAKVADKPRQPPKTLTNNLSASTQNARPRPMTDEERVAKAIAYAKGLRT